MAVIKEGDPWLKDAAKLIKLIPIHNLDYADYKAHYLSELATVDEDLKILKELSELLNREQFITPQVEAGLGYAASVAPTELKAALEEISARLEYLDWIFQSAAPALAKLINAKALEGSSIPKSMPKFKPYNKVEIWTGMWGDADSFCWLVLPGLKGYLQPAALPSKPEWHVRLTYDGKVVAALNRMLSYPISKTDNLTIDFSYLDPAKGGDDVIWAGAAFNKVF